MISQMVTMKMQKIGLVSASDNARQTVTMGPQEKLVMWVSEMMQQTIVYYI